jgi:hypothetical protein
MGSGDAYAATDDDDDEGHEAAQRRAPRAAEEQHRRRHQHLPSLSLPKESDGAAGNMVESPAFLDEQETTELENKDLSPTSPTSPLASDAPGPAAHHFNFVSDRNDGGYIAVRAPLVDTGATGHVEATISRDDERGQDGKQRVAVEANNDDATAHDDGENDNGDDDGSEMGEMQLRSDSYRETVQDTRARVSDYGFLPAKVSSTSSLLVKGGADEEFTTQSTGPPSLLPKAGIISRWTYLWLTPFVRLVHDVPLTERLLPAHVPQDAPRGLIPEFIRFWDERVAQERDGGPKATVWGSIIAFHRLQLLWSLVILFVCAVAWVASPALWINLILRYIESGRGDNLGTGLPLVFGLMVSEMIRFVTIQQYWWRGVQMASRARTLVFGRTTRRHSSHRPWGSRWAS